MSELILYTNEDGQSRIQLRANDGTVWLTQRDMAELFQVSTDNIGLHLKNIYTDDELSSEATSEESSVVQTEGQRRSEEHTSELQSRGHLVCRLLLEKKNRHTMESRTRSLL